MKSSQFCTVLQASILAFFATTSFAQAPSESTGAPPTATVVLGPIQTLNCYSGPGPLEKENTDLYQTSGICQPVCGNLGHAVMAITGGSTCYCGDELPPLSLQVDDSKCNTPCQGFGKEMCGGVGYWQVYLTGLTGDVETAPNSTTSSTQSSTASSSSSSSHVPATVVVTASTTVKPSESSTPGPNKVGIAVGVVVGVVAIAALAGGIIFFMKQKRRREIEEEHKAQAAVNSFVGARLSDQKSDSRLDPSVASSYRRESIGSIADERDFSRRILQVRNPDRGSMNSFA